MGYPYLAELAQRGEHRQIVETFASEITREWFSVVGRGYDNKHFKIQAIERWMDDMGVKEHFRNVLEKDGYFGRAQLFIDMKRKATTPLSVPLTLHPTTIVRNSVLELRVIEPMWTYPGNYEATSPLQRHFYKPQTWYIMGEEVHHSRLVTVVGREVPDMLKPVYMFGGQSMTQVAQAYVENWLEVRQSATDLLKSFSTMALATDMSSLLDGGDGGDLQARVEAFNRYRNNRGTFVYDKDREELKNIAVPLGTIDKLQAQAQEHMAGIARIPLIKLFGIQPAGLNASSEGEIQSFDDTLKAYAIKTCKAPLLYIVRLAQLSLFGEIDPDLSVMWNSLRTTGPREDAEILATRAKTGATLIEAGVIRPQEERDRVANEKDSMYSRVDLTRPAPGPPATAATDPTAQGAHGVEGAPEAKGDLIATEDAEHVIGRALGLAFDAVEWVEDDHPRADDGRWTRGSGVGVRGEHEVDPKAPKNYPKDSKAALAVTVSGKFTKAGKGVAKLVKERGTETEKDQFNRLRTLMNNVISGEVEMYSSVLSDMDPELRDEFKLLNPWESGDHSDVAKAINGHLMDFLEELGESEDYNDDLYLGGGDFARPEKYSPSVGDQKEAYARATEKGHRRLKTSTKIQTAAGEVDIGHDVSTESIPGGYYERITAAMGGSLSFKKGSSAHNREVSKLLQEYSDIQHDAMTQEERDQIESYQGMDYESINEYMRGGPMIISTTSTGPGSMRYAVKTLTDTINKSIIPADMPVYRGFAADIEDIFPDAEPGKVYQHDNFMSTSRSPNIASSFSAGNPDKPGVLLRMVVPAGASGLVMKYQDIGNEQEILLNHSAMLRFDSVEKRETPQAPHVVNCTFVGYKHGKGSA